MIARAADDSEFSAYRFDISFAIWRASFALGIPHHVAETFEHVVKSIVLIAIFIAEFGECIAQARWLIDLQLFINREV